MQATTTGTNANLWKKTTDVTTWFSSIPNKKKATFISFDIVEFYPSISEELLSKAIEFSQRFYKITDLEKQIIMQTKKSLLFPKNEAWEKKNNKVLFDVTMGSFDGAETCELVAVYMLNELKRIIPDIGLYRDDGLAFSVEPPQKVERMKKQICKIFNEHGLKIKIEANKKILNFLDVTIDLQNNIFYPYMKPGNTPVYVNSKSNHPPSIIKAIPQGVNKRLCSISSNKEVFEKAAPPYQEALKRSGYGHVLTYSKKDELKDSQAETKRKKNRKRNITWFNPPYDINVKNNIGKEFLNIVNTCFHKGSKLKNLFNKNTVKISYSCMANVKNIIESHNKKIEEPEKNNKEKTCNCRNKTNCPLNGNCKTSAVIYQASVNNENGEQQSYVGLTEGEFKSRYNNHKHSFQNQKQENATELSKYIWKLKKSNTTYTISWKILAKAKPYTNKTKRCNLCILEKFFIIYHPELSTLNKKSELISTCRHAAKYLIKNTK